MAQKVHPSYSLTDADLILLSSDGVEFRVHSNIMKLASGTFRGMMEGSFDSGEPIPMQEDSATLENMLGIIYPNIEGLRIDTFDLLDRLTSVAEKYDVPAVIAHVRIYFRLNPLLRDRPLEMYGLACHNGWEEEAKVASTWTLSTDLNSRAALTILESLDTKSVLKLQALHRSRKDGLDSAIARCMDYGFGDPPELVIHWNDIINGFDESGCSHKYPDHHYTALATLRFIVSREMGKFSAGDSHRLSIATTAWDYEDGPEAPGIWNVKCPYCGVQPVLDMQRTINEICRVLDLLPTTI